MKKVIVWTQEDCPLCERIKEILSSGDFEERPAERLISGDDRDRDAMAQLAMQDMTVPVIMIDEDFIEPNEFLKQHGSEAA